MKLYTDRFERVLPDTLRCRYRVPHGNWLITIWRREFSDNIARRTYTKVFHGDYNDALTDAKLAVVYKDEWFTIERV